MTVSVYTHSLGVYCDTIYDVEDVHSWQALFSTSHIPRFIEIAGSNKTGIYSVDDIIRIEIVKD